MSSFSNPHRPDVQKRPNSFNFRPGMKPKITLKTPVLEFERPRPGILKTPTVNLQNARERRMPYGRAEKYSANKENNKCAVSDDSWDDVMDEPFDSSQLQNMENNLIDQYIEKKCAALSKSVRASFSGPSKIVPQFDRSRFDQKWTQQYNYPPTPTPKKKQTILNTETPKISFQLKHNNKQQEVMDSVIGNSITATPQKKMKMSSPKIFPKWSPSEDSNRTDSKLSSSDLSFPRMLTLSIQKLQSWPKILTGGKVIIELFGILDHIADVLQPRAKKIFLKAVPKGNIQCLFYEIDRKLPDAVKGQWQRCICIFRLSGEFQCLSLRRATQEELKNLDSMQAKGSKAAAMLLRALKCSE